VWEDRWKLQQLEDVVMTNESAPEMRVSNWTLATGTQAGERHVYPTVPQEVARPPVPNVRVM
jgi:hypothetical protein